MTNFDKPYQSASIHEFWKRWHISLSTWFKDYLYISIGGNRVTIPRWYLNLFIVFLVSGLWHGANWTFIIWGALHGFYLVFAIVTKDIRESVNRFLYLDKIKILPVLTTFVLVAFAWIFFRAENVSTALYIIKTSVLGFPQIVSGIFHGQPVFEFLGLTTRQMILSVFLIILLESVHVLQNKIDLGQFFTKRPIYIRWAVYYALILIIIFYGVFEDRQFIYFQF